MHLPSFQECEKATHAEHIYTPFKVHVVIYSGLMYALHKSKLYFSTVFLGYMTARYIYFFRVQCSGTIEPYRASNCILKDVG